MGSEAFACSDLSDLGLASEEGRGGPSIWSCPASWSRARVTPFHHSLLRAYISFRNPAGSVAGAVQKWTFLCPLTKCLHNTITILQPHPTRHHGQVQGKKPVIGNISSPVRAFYQESKDISGAPSRLPLTSFGPEVVPVTTSSCK